MKNASKFGRGGCFKCCDCGRKTRDAGDNGAAELCPECYERGSWENEVSDNGETPKALAEIERLRAAAIAKGGVFSEPAVAAPAPQVAPPIPTPEEQLAVQFNAELNGAQRAFEGARIGFIKEVSMNPTGALKIHSDSMMQAQYRYETLLKANRHIAINAEATNGKGSMITVLAEFVEDLDYCIASSIGTGESTSLIHRAAHLAMQKADVEISKRLKHMLKMFA